MPTFSSESGPSMGMSSLRSPLLSLRKLMADSSGRGRRLSNCWASSLEMVAVSSFFRWMLFFMRIVLSATLTVLARLSWPPVRARPTDWMT